MADSPKKDDKDLVALKETQLGELKEKCWDALFRLREAKISREVYNVANHKVATIFGSLLGRDAVVKNYNEEIRPSLEEYTQQIKEIEQELDALIAQIQALLEDEYVKEKTTTKKKDDNDDDEINDTFEDIVKLRDQLASSLI